MIGMHLKICSSLFVKFVLIVKLYKIYAGHTVHIYTYIKISFIARAVRNL